MTGRMNLMRLSGLVLIFAGAIGLTDCGHKNPFADLPDMEGIMDGIRFLDSLAGSKQIDSIGQIHDQLTALLEAGKGSAQTAEDKVMLDSLNILATAAYDLVTYCNNARVHLELMEQDTKALEIQYRSGRIKISEYAAALLETEQILVSLNHELALKHQRALHLLQRRPSLTNRLSQATGTRD